jgi:hypothetical protein
MKSRALLVGINEYPGAPLAGCVNDVQDMANFLVGRCGFELREIRLLTDARATTRAILDRLLWLVDGIKAGDRILFHYSGHGAQIASRDPVSAEVDGLDEIICPVDFQWKEGLFIRDNHLNDIFSSVPPCVEALWISDSCHSGDLSRGFDPPSVRRPRALHPPLDIAWRNGVAVKEKVNVRKLVPGGQLNVTLLSACQSNQTASDALFNHRPNGAFTYSLLEVLNREGALESPLDEVFPHIHATLEKSGYKQNPGLEGGKFGQRIPFMTRF